MKTIFFSASEDTAFASDSHNKFPNPTHTKDAPCNSAMPKKKSRHPLSMSRTHCVCIILFVLFTFLHTNGQAQSIRFGVTGGLQLTKDKRTNNLLGYNIGAKGIYEFSEKENTGYLDINLLFSAKGWKENVLTDLDRFMEWKCRLYYIELPVHAGYKFALNERARFFIDAGPYVAIGLSGKYDFEDPEHIFDDQDYDDINLFTEKIYKRFDFGLGAKVGVEIGQKFQVAVGYDTGLLNPLHHESSKHIKLHNMAFTFTLAYLL